MEPNPHIRCTEISNIDSKPQNSSSSFSSLNICCICLLCHHVIIHVITFFIGVSVGHFHPLWDQIHWNVFKYKHFFWSNTFICKCISNTNTFQMKRTNSLFFLCFLFWYTHYITSQHQLDLSHQIMNFLLITPEEHKMFKILVGMSVCIGWNNEWYMLEGWSFYRKDEICSLDLLTRCFILSFDPF